MYSYISGNLVLKKSELAVVDCNGIGYEIHIPVSTFEKLPALNSQIKLHIHYSFNESDGTKLFGFYTELERTLFRLLISISKIGPKIALAVLSGLPAKDFIRGVMQEDVVLLSTIPGIGKKSAERLIIELKDKMSPLVGCDDLSEDDMQSSASTKETESALLALGYKQIEIRNAINTLLKTETFNSSEDLIKAVIKSLYNKRNI